jgi:hypothetical protein
MIWSFVGQKKVLAPFTSLEKVEEKENSDGSFSRTIFGVKPGTSVPGWKGAPWAPVDMKWVARDAWIVEGKPKDPYYAFGKMTYYIDKESDVILFKVINDRVGQYWKIMILGSSYHYAKNWSAPTQDVYIMVDSQSRHSTYSVLKNVRGRGEHFNIPLAQLGPSSFTEAGLIQLSK